MAGVGFGGGAQGAKVTYRVTLGELWGCLHSRWLGAEDSKLLASGLMRRMYCRSCEVLHRLSGAPADRLNVVESHPPIWFV